MKNDYNGNHTLDEAKNEVLGGSLWVILAYSQEKNQSQQPNLTLLKPLKKEQIKPKDGRREGNNKIRVTVNKDRD